MFIWISGSIILFLVEWFPTYGYVNFHDVVDKGVSTSSLPFRIVYEGEIRRILGVDCV